MTIKLSKILTRNNLTIPFGMDSDSKREFISDRVEIDLLEKNSIIAITTEILDEGYTKKINFYFEDNNKDEIIKFLLLLLSNNQSTADRLEEATYFISNDITLEWKVELN
jgi:hypothetical protein